MADMFNTFYSQDSMDPPTTNSSDTGASATTSTGAAVEPSARQVIDLADEAGSDGDNDDDMKIKLAKAAPIIVPESEVKRVRLAEPSSIITNTTTLTIQKAGLDVAAAVASATIAFSAPLVIQYPLTLNRIVVPRSTFATGGVLTSLKNDLLERRRIQFVRFIQKNLRWVQELYRETQPLNQPLPSYTMDSWMLALGGHLTDNGIIKAVGCGHCRYYASLFDVILNQDFLKLGKGVGAQFLDLNKCLSVAHRICERFSCDPVVVDGH